MIKVTIRELLNSQGALQQLAQKELPAALAFRISDVHRAASTHLSNYFERHQETMVKYKVEENQRMIDAPKGFQKEIEDLQGVTVPLHVEPISRDSFIETIESMPENRRPLLAPQLFAGTHWLWTPSAPEEGDGE